MLYIVFINHNADKILTQSNALHSDCQTGELYMNTYTFAVLTAA